jgi:hypothetical protein
MTIEQWVEAIALMSAPLLLGGFGAAVAIWVRDRNREPEADEKEPDPWPWADETMRMVA